MRNNLCTKCKIQEAKPNQSWCNNCKNIQKQESRRRAKELRLKEKILPVEGYKLCTRCKIEKEIIKFNKTKPNWCIECVKEYNKTYYQNNIDKIKKQKSDFYQNNKAFFAEKNKIYAQNNKEHMKEYHANYYQNNKDDFQNKSNLYRQNNKEKIKEMNSNYYQNNKDKISKANTEYRLNNKDSINAFFRVYKKDRRENDPGFALRENISKMIHNHLNNNGYSKNNESHLPFLPYTYKELRNHLENLFEPWMNWSNQGLYVVNGSNAWNDNDPNTWKWQLDHIIPHSTFHYETMDCQEFRDCWALSNLRPLSAKQNQLDGVTRIRHKS